MLFKPTIIDGVWLIYTEPRVDDRGSFTRVFCEDEFERNSLCSRFEQSSISSNNRAGTLRGLHFSRPPLLETKLVRCVRGAIFDVAVDLRAASPTRGKWIGVELTAGNQRALYISSGIAHGFQTLVADTEVHYQITPRYQSGYDNGVRWNDPAFGIEWPLPDPSLSDRDRNFDDWRT